MQTITTNDIIQIARQIVIDWPYIPCKQVDTFTTIFDGSEFDSSNFNKSMNDYKSGLFWSRHWVNGGADPSQMKAKYPIIGIEKKKSFLKDLDRGEVCPNFSLVVADQYDCESCPYECKRPRDVVSIDTEQMLYDFLLELVSYKQYQILKDGNEYFAWLSKGRYEYLINDGENPLDYIETCEEIEAQINIDRSSISEWGLGLGEKIIGWTVDFQICGCVQQKTQFNYAQQDFTELGITKCSTCP